MLPLRVSRAPSAFGSSALRRLAEQAKNSEISPTRMIELMVLLYFYCLDCGQQFSIIARPDSFSMKNRWKHAIELAQKLAELAPDGRLIYNRDPVDKLFLKWAQVNEELAIKSDLRPDLGGVSRRRWVGSCSNFEANLPLSRLFRIDQR